MLAAAVLAASAATASAEIRIAVAGPMSGSLALLGIQIRSGAEAAVAAINADGGLLGEEVVLEIVDDGCAADRAEAVANQIAGAGVVFVAGHLCSSAAIAAARVYAAEEIVLISPGAPAARFTDERPGPGIFRLFGREDEQAPTIARFMLDQPDDTTIAIIDDRRAYGSRLADAIVDALAEADRGPDLVESYSVSADIAALVAELAGLGIDILFIGASAEDVAAIRVEMDLQGYDALLLSGDALVDQAFVEIAGDAADGTLFTYQPDPLVLPGAQPAIARIVEDGGSPDGLALYAYAAIEVWAEAVRQNGASAFDVVSATIADGTFQTAVGQVQFGPGGDLQAPGWVWYQWMGGEIVPYAP